MRRPLTALTDQSPTHTPSSVVELLHQLETAEAETRHLRRALERSRDIGAAIGVLMAFHKVTQDEAFEMLRRSSQHHNRKVHALAIEVISTGALPEA
jgi:AmiR/NasT family two-component response regulator